MTGTKPDAEIGALLATLGEQRHHVLGILDGLDDEALRRPVLPSGWTPAGLVRHLALDVERFWFRAVVAGEQDVVAGFAESPEDAWKVDPDVPAKTVLDLYRQEAALADTVITAAAPDDAPAWWPEAQFGDWRLGTVREVLLHVIVETACHAGHLDAARELLDGRTWLILAD